MREIVFRGKRKDTGEWVQGFINPPCNICFETVETVEESDPPVWNDYAVDPETVGQYIGLTDRNGRRIFEGDVVKHYLLVNDSDLSETGCVAFDQDRCVYFRTPGRTPLYKHCRGNYEVIGNVYDNPELREALQ